MSIETDKRTLPNSMDGYQSVVILPSNYSNKNAETDQYSSSSLSFKKYAEETLPIEFFSEPELLYERRSGEWFSPVLLITSAAIAANPHLISITCSIIANYITETFRGNSAPTIKLKILSKKTGKTETREFTYEGDAAGLATLKDSIENITAKDD